MLATIDLYTLYILFTLFLVGGSKKNKKKKIERIKRQKACILCIFVKTMKDCHKHIETIYLSPQINQLIKSVRPESLQDDLRQEMALALLGIDCEKINEIWASNGLLGFSIKIITNMAFSSTSQFYKKFRKNEYDKAIAYLKSQLKLPELNPTFAKIANKRLIDKYAEDEMQAHEAILFNKYVEFRSCKKVAEFYSIPEKHVKDIIRKTKLELRNLCLNQNL